MIKNGQIVDTMLGREDHGIMTWMITVEADFGTFGFGYRVLDEYDEETKTRKFSSKAMESISTLLDVVGVTKWEDLKGRYVRFEDTGWGNCVDRVGNIMKNKWFDLDEFFKGDSDG